jgi:uncharacterized phage protein gp47/JayE
VTSKLTSTGLAAPNLAEIKTALEDALKARLGNSLNFLPNTVNAQIVGVVSEQLDDVWDTLTDIYSGLDPDVASGVLLDALCALTGISRLAATQSTVALTLNLDATTTVPAGSLVSHATTGVQFQTRTAVTSTTSGNYTVVAESVDTGPIQASAGTLTVIDSPVTGWNTVTNAADATAGRSDETDSELRIRRTQSLAVQGGSTIDAIVADVGQVSDVTIVRGYENTSSTTDSDGRPGHSFEIVLIDNAAADDSIAQAIWDSKPAGIQSYGGSGDSGTATDDAGETHTVDFTRATQVDIHVDVELDKDANTYAGDAAVKSAIVAAVNENTIGVTQYASVLYEVVLDVAGVVNVVSIDISKTDPPSGSSVTLSYDESPSYTIANIDVTANNV